MGVAVRRYIDILIIIITFPYIPLVYISSFLAARPYFFIHFYIQAPPAKTMSRSIIIESVDSISRDERGFPLMQYITNGRISRTRHTITHFKHHHRILRLISNRISV